MNIRSPLRTALISAAISMFVVLLGLTGLAGALLVEWFELPSPRPGAWGLLGLIAFWGGWSVSRQETSASWQLAALTALVSGIVHSLVFGLFVWLVAALTASGADIRKWLVQLSPEAMEVITMGRPPLPAAALATGILAGLGIIGGLLGHLWTTLKTHAPERAATEGPRTFAELIRRTRENRYAGTAMIIVGIGVLLAAPFALGQYWNYILGTVGIYIILGLGLNIVVGMAGLLNLGYVAFFAIGAYTMALLTAPEPHGLMLDFWVALPIGVVLATLTGVLLCIPVLHTRGDYLAIVTLGFGEIIRILAKSDALTDFTGGPRGVRAVGGPSLFGTNINTGFYFMYMIILGILLVAYITYRLQSSRVGRAWMAMREDEDVAQGMGIHTLKYKLLAFAIGAAFAGLGGAIFASRNKFTGPEDFTLLVSINVLCLVIIGGMGSIPGVVLGALVLKGLPEILRQLDDYRMLAFGALLIVMMILRPEGLWPSPRRRMELQDRSEAPVDAST